MRLSKLGPAVFQAQHAKQPRGGVGPRPTRTGTWTGYFTSEPKLKGAYRDGMRVYPHPNQTCTQKHTFVPSVVSTFAPNPRWGDGSGRVRKIFWENLCFWSFSDTAYSYQALHLGKPGIRLGTSRLDTVPFNPLSGRPLDRPLFDPRLPPAAVHWPLREYT